MKTLTASKARQNLSHWLSRAVNGEDIGIVCGANIVALRPVEVHTSDYVLQEYGVLPEEADKALKKAERDIRRERRAGKLVAYERGQLRRAIAR